MKKNEDNNQKPIAKTISKEVKNIIKQLKNSEISCFLVPDDYRYDKNIIDVERKLGIRKIGKRGYDIIRNTFFVEEELKDGDRTKKEITFFDDFESYSVFLDDEIYDNACYYHCDISKIRTDIDYDRLYEKVSFVEDTIEDYTIISTGKETSFYCKEEQLKKQCKKWMDRFCACLTVDEFLKVEQNYRKSKLLNELAGNTWYLRRKYENFFLWQYIFSALNDKSRFNILMEYLSKFTCAGCLVREICTVFDPDDVMDAYNYKDSSERGIYNQKKRLKDIVAAIKNGLIDKSVYAYFDESSHYYCEECTYTLQEEKTWMSEGLRKFSTFRYFETFEDFIKYRNGDLTHCDLTKDIKNKNDFTNCKMDKTTKLPIVETGNLRYVVKKVYFDDKFKVLQAWYNSDDVLVEKYDHDFDYFFDFVAFLKGDLSNADLLLCEGLRNLSDKSGINLHNARVTSTICEKFGISYEPYEISNDKLGSFSCTEENEKITELALQASRELDAPYEHSCLRLSMTMERVYYVSDIHLLHKLRETEPKSKDDVEYAIRSIVGNIVKESGHTILIGGDVSSDFSIFELFIKMLRSEIDRSRRNPLVVH